jgi:hypothetical protein
MDWTDDELAGVVDTFGALTRAELERALSELAFRDGEDLADDELDAIVGTALDEYALVAYDPGPDADVDEDLVVAGPTTFPTLPEHGDDLPHIMDVEHRRVDRERAGEQVADLMRETAADLEADDPRRERLLDLTYEVEAWAPIDLDDLRDQLADE